MPKFMRSHDDAGETASVLDDGHTVHLVAKAQRSKDGEQQIKKTKHNSQKTENNNKKPKHNGQNTEKKQDQSPSQGAC